MSFTPGALVKARGREWVVLPSHDETCVLARPVGGRDEEIAALLPGREEIAPAQFGLPDPTRLGDRDSARLLQGALRLSIRASAGPFRSFAHLGFDPRPYQLVPLLMALRLDPVRLLIADGVGVGKTVEAGLIARELLDRREQDRLAVLCPPNLVDQWVRELETKFNIPAVGLTASTAARLERQCIAGQSVLDRFPYLVVSTDFVKADRRRDDFIARCPKLVIVDEAHTCARGSMAYRGRHQRYELVHALAEDRERDLILLTGTPHNGNPDSFRSMTGILDPAFEKLPDDLSGAANAGAREHLARQYICRQRPDIEQYVATATTFPEPISKELAYKMSFEYNALFDDVLSYLRERLSGPGADRAGFWSAVTILRALSSSPAAANATLQCRSPLEDLTSEEAIDEAGRRALSDEPDEAEEAPDGVPGAGYKVSDAQHRRLREFASRARALQEMDKDTKLRIVKGLVRQLINEGRNPIVFCRFIETAKYVGEALATSAPQGVRVETVTSLIAPSDREQRVRDLTAADRRVLVATDCLSEGVNLQQAFDAVIHYDLAWSPTRHEQREGRVNRFGQPRRDVRLYTIWCKDNGIDHHVIEILLRKRGSIRKQTGVSVHVDAVAATEAILTRALQLASTQQTELFDEEIGLAEEREAAEELVVGKTRSAFAHGAVRTEDVVVELDATRQLVGGAADVARFVRDVLVREGAHVTDASGAVRFDLQDVSGRIAEAIGRRSKAPWTVRFDPPAAVGTTLLTRTSAPVAALATHTLETALDSRADHALASRCGVYRVAGLVERTVLLVLRFRLRVEIGAEGALAESSAFAAFRGSAASPQWLPETEAAGLADAPSAGNVPQATALRYARETVDALTAGAVQEQLVAIGLERALELERAHARVRKVAQRPGRRTGVRATALPADILGVYVLLPPIPKEAAVG